MRISSDTTEPDKLKDLFKKRGEKKANSLVMPARVKHQEQVKESKRADGKHGKR